MVGLGTASDDTREDLLSQVTHLDLNPWRSRAALAEALGMSERTISRMVKRGELERRESPEGTQYRRHEPGAPGTGQDVSWDMSSDASEAIQRLMHQHKLAHADARRLALELGQAQGELVVMRAELAKDRAELEHAQVELERERAANALLRVELEHARSRPSLARWISRVLGALKRLADQL